MITKDTQELVRLKDALLKATDPMELAEFIGEGVHVGLRKGTDASDADHLWKTIADSDTDAWSDAALFASTYLSERLRKVLDV